MESIRCLNCKFFYLDPKDINISKPSVPLDLAYREMVKKYDIGTIDYRACCLKNTTEFTQFATLHSHEAQRIRECKSFEHYLSSPVVHPAESPILQEPRSPGVALRPTLGVSGTNHLWKPQHIKRYRFISTASCKVFLTTFINKKYDRKFGYALLVLFGLLILYALIDALT
jgi:hypothetical protein